MPGSSVKRDGGQGWRTAAQATQRKWIARKIYAAHGHTDADVGEVDDVSRRVADCRPAIMAGIGRGPIKVSVIAADLKVGSTSDKRPGRRPTTSPLTRCAQVDLSAESAS
jgi:hypothetical protein